MIRMRRHGKIHGERTGVVGVVGVEDLPAVVDGWRTLGCGGPESLQVPVEEQGVQLARWRGFLDELEKVGGAAVFGVQRERCLVVSEAYFSTTEPVHLRYNLRMSTSNLG